VPQTPRQGRQSLGVLVHGRVHGVNYRSFVQREARRRGLTGYCRNLPNGDVEVHAEGEEDALHGLLHALSGSDGPGIARVDGLDVTLGPATGRHASFEIRW